MTTIRRTPFAPPRRVRAPAFSFLAAAVLLAGCGAGPAQNAPPAAPAAQSAPPPLSGDAAAAATDASPAAAASPPGAMAPPPPPAAPRPETVAQGSQESSSMAVQVGVELKKAEHEIAAGDCPTACRALASMEHAVVFLCTGNRTTDESDRCDHARRRLIGARRRVRANCGACGGGPSVEPDAPIPSTR